MTIAWVRPSELIVLAWALAVAASLPRARGPWVAAALGLALRVLAYGPDVHLHADKAYHLLDTPFRATSADLRYGDGWPALMVLAGAVLRHPDTVHLVDTVLAALTVPFAGAAVAAVAGARAGTLAALLLAVLPLPVASADHEHQLVLVGLLQATAVTGLLRGRGCTDEALAALSLGLLAHTRPLEIGEAWLGVAALALGRRGRAAAVAGALVLWRTVELGAFVAGGGNASGAQLDRGLSWDLVTHLVGPGARVVPLDPTVTPLGVAVLALAGAALAVRSTGGRLLVAALALDVGLYVVQPLAPDRLRLQLPAQVWVAALAGVALDRLALAAPRAVLPVALGVAASFVPARAPFDPPWSWQEEHRLLREALPAVPAGAVVRVDEAGALADWAARRTGARWWTLQGPVAPGEWRWVGLADAERADVTGLVPVRVATIPVFTEGTGPTPSTPTVTIGLWRR